MNGLITDMEMGLAQYCLEAARRHGAEQARVSLSKSVLDTFGMLNAGVDKVTHAADRSIFIYVFADGRYGTFSTNMLDREELDRFTARAVETVKMLAEDRYRTLPDPSRTARDAASGLELGLYDREYELMDSETRLGLAMRECRFKDFRPEAEYNVISEECEYSDSVDDNFLIDSSGFSGRHIETSFAVCSEVTISDRKGRKYSGYWWDSSPFAGKLNTGTCSQEALARAASQLNPVRHKGGRLCMVVDNTVSSRLVAPLISALNASSIQQKSSFLEGTAGKQVFSGKLTILDLARTPGKPGSRLFDTEGIATKDAPVIENGTVCGYFVNTYMAAKMNMAPTVEGVSRPVLVPCLPGCLRDGCYHGLEAGHGSIHAAGAAELMSECGSGIYVTGFNGGNCNPVTGDFSYGIEGFSFAGGKVLHPVREMVVTGNMLTLWNNLVSAGNDARECTRWQIPSLSFENVDFSG